MTHTHGKLPLPLILLLVTGPLSLYLLLISGVIAEEDFQWVARSRHNRYRARHDAEPLSASAELSRRAMKCAQYYVDQGSIDHSCPYVKQAGENIWAQYGGRSSFYTVATRAIDSWYKEGSRYRYDDHQSGTGHFTQMVWQDTKQLGFGVAQQGSMAVAVALYTPAGNYLGEYNQNVKRPRR